MLGLFGLSTFGSTNPFLKTILAMLGECLWFGAGFLLFKAVSWYLANNNKKSKAADKVSSKENKGDTKKVVGTPKAHPRSVSAKALCEHAQAGNFKGVLEKWADEKNLGLSALPVDALKAVAEALVELNPENFSEDIIEYLGKHQEIARPAVVHSLMEVAYFSNKPSLATELGLAVAASSTLKLGTSGAKFGEEPRTKELLLSSFAAQGHEEKVNELLKASGASTVALSAAIRGYLKGGYLSEATRCVNEMQKQGMKVPAKALLSLYRNVCSLKDDGQLLLQALEDLKDVPLTAEAAAMVLTNCLDREDVKTALKVEKQLTEQKTPFTFGVLEPLLKIMSKVDEPHALQLFEEMQSQNFHLSEGLCGYILARCGEPRHMELVERVTTYLESRKMMTLSVYKTLMKVHATCGSYNKACGLYHKLKADGLEPDRVMYGCLAKFSAKCGAVDLASEIYRAQQGQNAMSQNPTWLIRNAGKEGDVDKALAIFSDLKTSRPEVVDGPLYNVVLDACINNGKTEEAEEIMKEMQERNMVSLVTYNTLMKGLCAGGQTARAKEMLKEIGTSGLVADAASYNCVISTAVASNDFSEAWKLYDEMVAAGLKADHYTISIMLKAARKSKKTVHADRAMKLLDQSDVAMFTDEVLLNTVIDACVHRRDYKRLKVVLSNFERAKDVKLTIQSYGLLIKAYGSLKMINKCWEKWVEMTETKGLMPSDVSFSCMLDALVSEGDMDSAIALFNQWRSVIPPNTIIFSTLIKGYASRGDARRAMEIYREVQRLGLPMNLVAYSSLIDAHARAGHSTQARAMMDQMKQDGIEPNTIAYSSLVKSYCRQGDLDGALKSFAEMISSGLQADTIIFNTLLDGAVRASRFELCDQLISEMVHHYQLKPSNFTLSIIIKMWGKRGNLDKAFEAVHHAIQTHKQPLDSQICSCVISACLHNREVELALKVMQEMKSWPNCDGPDAGTYDLLITGLLRNDCIREAAGAASEAIELSSGPKASIWPIKQDTLAQLWKKLTAKGMCELWPAIEGRSSAYAGYQ
eukprot:TRINITY_DN64404_c0_g1_i1.p1 TRINITY_DN64404_c0_g1~~TRINITY_DN64404_c0_g1_i1.p1  ORF type:complete len:1037 (-),score=216.61 TRINITY_DN64404_c0_g1_i1:169-3279(-)